LEALGGGEEGGDGDLGGSFLIEVGGDGGDGTTGGDHGVEDDDVDSGDIFWSFVFVTGGEEGMLVTG
jgi:hypothetical protein